jgi:hypothetical protein
MKITKHGNYYFAEYKGNKAIGGSHYEALQNMFKLWRLKGSF